MRKSYDQIKKYIEADIEYEVRLLVSDFAILWNSYEKKLFSDENGNPFYKFSKMISSENSDETIIDKAMNNMTTEHANELTNLYNKFLEYFMSRHAVFSAERFKSNYNVRSSDISDEKLKNLIEGSTLENKYLLLMLMVGRVRNNMFHGIKIVKELNNQKELFEICNRLLVLTLDIMNVPFLSS